MPERERKEGDDRRVSDEPLWGRRPVLSDGRIKIEGVSDEPSWGRSYDTAQTNDDEALFQTNPRGVEAWGTSPAHTRRSSSRRTLVGSKPRRLRVQGPAQCGFQTNPRGIEASESSPSPRGEGSFQTNSRGVEATPTRTPRGPKAVLQMNLCRVKTCTRCTACRWCKRLQMNPCGVEASRSTATRRASGTVPDEPPWGRSLQYADQTAGKTVITDESTWGRSRGHEWLAEWGDAFQRNPREVEASPA